MRMDMLLETSCIKQFILQELPLSQVPSCCNALLQVALEKEVATNICGAMAFQCSVGAAIVVFLMKLLLIALDIP
nr:hypothetical protein [Tanacetum cinerariifolium]